MEKKILILDDDPGIRKLLNKIFKSHGFEVTLAEDTPEVEKILEKNNFPVLLFDLNLPTETGIELCKKVKKRNPIPIIFAMTGHVSVFELADCRSAGFDDYFKKPFDMNLLVEEIERAYNRIARWSSKGK